MDDQNLLIKYQQQKDNESLGFDLSLLGESFIGFNDLFKEYFEVSGIQGDLVVRTEKISEGSIEVFNAVQVVNYVPIQDVPHLLDFLQITNQEIYQQATTYFNQFGNFHKSANALYAEYPLTAEIIKTLLTVYLTKMFVAGGKVKKNAVELENGKPFPQRYITKLKQLVQSGKYKKVLKPVIENNVSSIALKTVHGQVVTEARVTEESLEGYLPDEEKILPELNNGDVKNFTGEIKALQSTKGERIKIKINEIDPPHQLLTARPADGQDTEDYKEFYKKMVSVKAEVLRASMYKRPELILHSVEKMEQELFDGYQNN